MFGCCCQCSDGAVIPRWLNTTIVRKTLDCAHPSTVTEVAPYSRYVEGGDYVICSAPGPLTKVPADWFADWLMLGDANGWSSQKISAIVDDIMACAGDDGTHDSIDHNCYTQSGTVDQRGDRLGGRWVLALKHWHGRFGFTSSECLADETVAADQTRYRTINRQIESTWKVGLESGGFVDGTASAESTWTVAQTTGIITGSVSGTVVNAADEIGNWPGSVLLIELMNKDYCGEAAWQAWFDSMEIYITDWVAVDPTNREGYFTVSSLTNTSVSFAFSQKFTYDSQLVGYDYTVTLTLSDPYTAADCLEDFYAALQDWDLSNAAINYVSAGKNWRTDEALALAPLCRYDEKQSAVNPDQNIVTFRFTDGATQSAGVFEAVVDDYSRDKDATDSEGRNPGDPGYVPTWHKRNWFDTGAYLWQYPDGSRTTMPVGFTGGATLLGPAFSGVVVAAGIEGGERIFWFNAETYERVYDSDTGAPAWHWNLILKGAASDTRLPEATRRWLSNYAAQYDSVAYRGVGVPPPSGVYPQAFLFQQNGYVLGAKHCEAAQEWPAVDFNYPCGDARFDVDQTAVCCLVSGDAATGFRVKQTGGGTSTVPNSTDYIFVEDDGIYQVSSRDSHGGSPAEWTLHVGAKIEDIPAGRTCFPKGYETADPAIYSDGTTHVGKLRWWTTTPTACVTPNPVNNKTGVKLAYTFNQRAAQLSTVDQPDWLGGSGAGTGTGIVGCTGLTMEEFTYSGRCPVVGWVPYYGGDPVENFTNQTLHAMPGSFPFDNTFGALWIGYIEMVMVDPFWQAPFKPDCNIDPETEVLNWTEDDGSGQGDTIDFDTITTYNSYYPHRKWVAARCSIPAGASLPSGLSLFYATGSIISPADGTNVHYDSTSGGIIIGDDEGNYREIERPWGFTLRACTVDNRFGDYYATFTNCP